MRLAIGTFLLFSALAQPIPAPTIGGSNADTNPAAATPALVRESSVESYIVFNATPAQETALRAETRAMQPDVLPLRVIFFPHWKYLDALRTFHLHVPAGYMSLMFTHLPSRTVFIDNDRYLGEEWLGYRMAHELGHLKANNASESDAERGAREFRRRLKEARNKGLL